VEERGEGGGAVYFRLWNVSGRGANDSRKHSSLKEREREMQRERERKGKRESELERERRLFKMIDKDITYNDETIDMAEQ
jgi:hypothetical protein